MGRKLASIRRIGDIQPIDGADMIELAIVDGWKVVVGKDVGHKIGDLVIYCEVDSFLPIKDEFEFLRKSSYKKMDDQEGFRLRTVKLRGQVSQGLLIPINELLKYGISSDDVYVGLDVTSILGIIKYEPPIPAELAGTVKGGFPSFIPKTDEERVQNIAVEYSSLCFSSKHQFYVTEKLDGSSATFYYKDGEFGICGRNWEYSESETNSFWRFARGNDLENKMRDFGLNISLQGEIIGEGVQGNPYKIKGQTVRFFNLFDIDNQEYHNLPMLEGVVNRFGLQTVPILSKNFQLPQSVEDILKYAEDKSVLNPNFDREGIVIRSLDRKISFKVISNKFLLNEK